MRILLTGATGGIGSAIKERLGGIHEVISVGHTAVFNMEVEDVDWLICAHGVLDEDDVIGTFFANVILNIRIAQHTKGANIIFISSTAGIKGNDRFPIYSASKAALNMYCKSISRTRKCYALCPGPTDTKMWRALGLEGVAQDPDEVAKAVQRIINGDIKHAVIITIRNGQITCEP